jgi:hypothetical protein
MNVEAAVRRIENRAAICDLKSTYFRLLDEKRWVDWTELFVPDCQYDVTDMGRTYDDREEFVAQVVANVGAAQTVHHGHMPEILILDDSRATGTWALFDYVEFEPAASGTRRGFHGYGRYFDEYREEEGDWRISRLALSRLRIDRLPA